MYTVTFGHFYKVIIKLIKTVQLAPGQLHIS